MRELIQNAKQAANYLYNMSDAQLGNLLSAVCRKLTENQKIICERNQMDVQLASADGMSSLRLQRLTLTPEALENTLRQIWELAKQPDLVNIRIREWELPDNMTAAYKQVPIGAIAAVFECRPTAPLEIMALCLRTGNSCILRGGPEMLETNRAIVSLVQAALREKGIPETGVQLMEDCSEEALCNLMKCQDLDLLMARGSQQLIDLVQENAKIPWLRLGPGNCHVYVDEAANLDIATEIISTAKSKPLLCNCVETALIHQKIASDFLPQFAERLSEEGITLRGCPESGQISSLVQQAEELEYGVEANDFILKVKIVSDLEEAVQHIRRFGNGHSEVIVTETPAAAEFFTNIVDAGAVYVNASCRFTDGASLALGMEVGISTQKLHIRGPVTVNALTTTKYIVLGRGNVR